MTDLGTRTMDPNTSDAKDLAESQETVMALRARDDIEQVVIETVHVGDDVFLEPDARPAGARRVIRMRAKTNERTARVVGWLLQLTGGQLAWWTHGALVWRRRTWAYRRS